MKVTKSEIVISAVKPEQYPEGGCRKSRLPEDQMSGNHHLLIQ